MLAGAQAVIDRGLDWTSFFSFSAEHGTLNLVYKNLLKLRGVPESVLQRCEDVYHHTLRSNILNIAEHDRTIDNLNHLGVDVISLKGPTASEEIFGDIGVYPSGDIDILVRVEDIDKARDFLESDGYVLLDKGFDEYRDFFIGELYHISLAKGRYFIEPHWNLFFRYFKTPPEFWWEDSRTVARGDKAYRFLSPERNILYNSFRLFSKAFHHLRFLVMAAELIRYYQHEIDWEKMFLYARRYKFENVLRTVLKMSADLLGAPVPASCTEVRGIRARAIYKIALKILLSGTGPHPPRKIMLSFMRDDLSGSFTVLLRRLFPSMGEIVSRYRLPTHSWRSVMYYILNPVFLVTRRHQGNQ